MNATATTKRDPLADAHRNGQAQVDETVALQSIHEWILAGDGREGNQLTDRARRILREEGWNGKAWDELEDRILERARGEALEVTLTGEWSPGEDPKPTGWRILLSWGGPACRLVGDCSRYGDPDSCRLEVQDWGTPWTYHPISEIEEEALLWFASQLVWA